MKTMNEHFKAYIPITKEEIDALWQGKTTLFILDTNILLNLYGYRKNTQDDFFKILKKLKDKIWIPYHVMLEYHRNRLKVINDKENTINEIVRCCNEVKLEFLNDKFENIEGKETPLAYKDFSRKYPDLRDEWTKIKKDINDIFSEKIKNYIEKIKQATDNDVGINNHDKVYDSLKVILQNIGKPYDQEFIETIKNDGELRFNHKRPPGYKDAAKGSSEENVFYHNGFAIPYRYGDLIIWEEIKQYVGNKDKLSKIENIVFVTDDNKNDWVQKHYSEGKTVSMARYELFDELLTKAKHINHFLIADSESFVEQSNQYLNLELNVDSVHDIKNTAAYNSKISCFEKNFSDISKRYSKKSAYSSDLENFKHLTINEKEKLFFRGIEKEHLLNSIKEVRSQIHFSEILLSEPQSKKDVIILRNRIIKLEKQLVNYLEKLNNLKYYSSFNDRFTEE